MRTTVIQMAPGASLPDNIAEARRLIAAAVSADRPDLVVLPEIWSCLGGTAEVKFASAEELPPPGAPEGGVGPLYRFLSETAHAHGITLHGGSIGQRCGDRLLNTSLIFGPDGVERARYSKIHLFDITTPGGEGYRESDTYAPGRNVVTVPVGPFMAGLAICYDIRFAELFLSLRRQGANLIILPAAFTAETGEAHWQTLLRARAIETQCWVVACGTTGTHADANGNARKTYGHSMIIDPWGTVVAQASNGIGWVTARLDLDMVERVRAGIPVMDHRRLTS
ncbi:MULTISPECIES: carbon-nitrogen hydrolase family protein [Nguyenibacter]|uniref:Carbon-nitrogen hydrolase family protein n=1 Tax=Nguyenibacter vanlangensis TaxID=1216886 RepID=A0A7Y7M5T1_9PROT|nr:MULTISPECIES: carbon-nitrogen hydrolase family protein [Nguyenibacter]NVN09941.1 carbon-nitrogen hydrolase family protein [Nguyenibacter vanlangensis]WRH86806.1 carbon-nitrogen hydrolase family protein [Nguyenibacter sp. L1]